MIKTLIQHLDCGRNPSVRINGHATCDSYLETNMMANVVAISLVNDKEDLLAIALDFKPFEDINKQFAVPDYYDTNNEARLTAYEAGMRPENGVDIIYYSPSDDELPIDLVCEATSDLVADYMLTRKAGQSYIAWLESRV